jgi:hypothetical protein
VSVATFRPSLPNRETLLYAALVLNTELLVVLFYPGIWEATVKGWLNVLYAFVWINVGVWAILTTDPPDAPRRQRRIALAVAVGYFALLAVVGGLVTVGDLFTTVAFPQTGPRIAWLIPGWGPAVTYVGDLFSVALLPYRVVGYLALSYLVYATVLDAAGSAVTGALGLLSCVSCTWPVLASLATGFLGSSSALALAVTNWSYEISTVVFIVTVALLYWRPFGR